MLPMAAGRRVTGRDCRFMVTTTEMDGLQGWFLQRLGCFPVDQGRPSMTTLRLAIDLLADGQQLVVFPEGRIQRQDRAIQLHQGLVRLAQLAQRRGVQVPVIPVGIGYGQAPPRPFSRAAICFGAPMTLPGDGSREAGQRFTKALATGMHAASITGGRARRPRRRRCCGWYRYQSEAGLVCELQLNCMNVCV